MCGRLESTTIPISAHMHGIALGQEYPVLLVKKAVVEAESGFTCKGKSGFDVDGIIVARGFVVATIGLVHWKKTTAFFQPRVTPMERPLRRSLPRQFAVRTFSTSTPYRR